MPCIESDGAALTIVPCQEGLVMRLDDLLHTMAAAGESVSSRFLAVLFETLVEAIRELHIKQSTLHGDLSPSNVLVTHTGGVLLCHPPYVPPEAIVHPTAFTVVPAAVAEVGPADLFSLGCLLHTVATGGVPPYHGSTEEDLRAAYAFPPPPLPSHLRSDVRQAVTFLLTQPALAHELLMAGRLRVPGKPGGQPQQGDSDVGASGSYHPMLETPSHEPASPIEHQLGASPQRRLGGPSSSGKGSPGRGGSAVGSSAGSVPASPTDVHRKLSGVDASNGAGSGSGGVGKRDGSSKKRLSDVGLSAEQIARDLAAAGYSFGSPTGSTASGAGASPSGPGMGVGVAGLNPSPAHVRGAIPGQDQAGQAEGRLTMDMLGPGHSPAGGMGSGVAMGRGPGALPGADGPESTPRRTGRAAVPGTGALGTRPASAAPDMQSSPRRQGGLPRSPVPSAPVPGTYGGLPSSPRLPVDGQALAAENVSAAAAARKRRMEAADQAAAVQEVAMAEARQAAYEERKRLEARRLEVEQGDSHDSGSAAAAQASARGRVGAAGTRPASAQAVSSHGRQPVAFTAGDEEPVGRRRVGGPTAGAMAQGDPTPFEVAAPSSRSRTAAAGGQRSSAGGGGGGAATVIPGGRGLARSPPRAPPGGAAAAVEVQQPRYQGREVTPVPEMADEGAAAAAPAAVIPSESARDRVLRLRAERQAAEQEEALKQARIAAFAERQSLAVKAKEIYTPSGETAGPASGQASVQSTPGRRAKGGMARTTPLPPVPAPAGAAGRGYGPQEDYGQWQARAYGQGQIGGAGLDDGGWSRDNGRHAYQPPQGEQSYRGQQPYAGQQGYPQAYDVDIYPAGPRQAGTAGMAGPQGVAGPMHGAYGAAPVGQAGQGGFNPMADVFHTQRPGLHASGPHSSAEDQGLEYQVPHREVVGAGPRTPGRGGPGPATPGRPSSADLSYAAAYGAPAASTSAAAGAGAAVPLGGLGGVAGMGGVGSPDIKAMRAARLAAAAAADEEALRQARIAAFQDRKALQSKFPRGRV